MKNCVVPHALSGLCPLRRTGEHILLCVLQYFFCEVFFMYLLSWMCESVGGISWFASGRKLILSRTTPRVRMAQAQWSNVL